jgi:two-component system NarL family sensor kinase
MKTPFRICLLIGLLCHYFDAKGQNHKIDSIYSVLKKSKEDTEKVNTLNALSKTLYLISKRQAADSMCREALALSEKLGFKKGVLDSYLNIGNVYFDAANYSEALNSYSQSLKIATELNNKQCMGRAAGNIGNIYFLQGKYPEALADYLQALNLWQAIDDKKGMSIAYTNIGNIYMTEGNFPEALKNQLQALKIKEDIKDKRGAGNLYGNIGSVYHDMGNYPEALKNHLQSLKICEETNNKIGEGNAYINMGNDYLAMGNFAEAIKSEQKSIEISTAINNKRGIMLAIQDIGNIYRDQHNYTQALENYSNSLKQAEELNDRYTLSMAYENIGFVLTRQNKYKEAAIYLDSALNLSKETGDKTNIRDSYTFRAMLDSATGNYKAAMDDYKNSIVYRDSLKNEENTRKITTEQMNYEFDKKQAADKLEQDKKDLINTEKLEKQKLLTWSAIGGGILILAFVGLLFNRARLKQKTVYQQELNQKQKEQAVAVMETQEQERKRIAEDLHDSLGYLLSTVKLNLQASSTDPKKTAEESVKLLNQASKEIHDITFNLMPRTLEEEGLVPALRELAARTANAGAAKINLDLHDVEGMTLEKQTQFTIYRIIQEAVNNVFKYADAKEINIQLIKQDGQLTIMLEDDGKGFNVTEVKKGRGLKNMMSRSEWLNGTLNIDSGQGHGTTIILEIPV